MERTGQMESSGKQMGQMERMGKWRVLLAGVLPLLVFTLIEEYFGTLWGLIAGMVFGLGEMAWEYVKQRRVEALTWGSNSLLLGLGGVSLLTQDGIWFKLQPSILEVALTAFLWGSVVLKKPLLFSLMIKQSAQMHGAAPLWPEAFRLKLERAFYGLTVRLGLFFFIHAGLALWVALYGSTSAWMLLKGVGLTLSLMVYMVVEMLFLRYRLRPIS